MESSMVGVKENYQVIFCVTIFSAKSSGIDA
jgi:hypothetical protein